MPDSRRKRVCGYVLLGIAVVALLAAMPCIGMGLLGLLGVLADVGQDENRRIGVQSLRISMIPTGISIVALVGAFVVLRRGRGFRLSRQDADVGES